MRKLKLITAILIVIPITGCGKFGDPVPPEAVSPRAVSELAVSADPSAVTLKWESPESDLQGKELKFIDGYKVYRKEMDDPDQLLDEDLEFEVVATLEDKHLIELDKMREDVLLKVAEANADPTTSTGETTAKS